MTHIGISRLDSFLDEVASPFDFRDTAIKEDSIIYYVQDIKNLQSFEF